MKNTTLARPVGIGLRAGQAALLACRISTGSFSLRLRTSRIGPETSFYVLKHFRLDLFQEFPYNDGDSLTASTLVVYAPAPHGQLVGQAPRGLSALKPQVSKSQKMQGPELYAVLRLTTAPVKLLSSASSMKITPAVALMLVRGGRYEGGGSTRRVRYIREISPGSSWQRCWRTTEAAVFPPWPVGVRC